MRLTPGRVPGALCATSPAWQALSWTGKAYVAGVTTAGVAVLALSFPRTLPQPVVFAALIGIACLTSAWKVTLPIPVANGSTLSVSYAANVMALLLLGRGETIVVALAGVITQCAYKPRQPYPTHRTLFSSAMAIVTMALTFEVYRAFGGTTAPTTFELARPLVAAIVTYFLANTGMLAIAIALSSNRGIVTTWRRDFLWSFSSFLAAGTAGAAAAIVIARGGQWKAVLLLAPVYLTYRTYGVFVGRLEDQNRHTTEIHQLHRETVTSLEHTRAAERALAGEKERLAAALVEMTRLRTLAHDLLARERDARAAVEEASRLKDQFLAVVSHELRTPLTAMLGWADLLCKGSMDDQLRLHACSSIAQNARRQARLIEDLLDVSRIGSGTLRLQKTLVDLREIVRDALQAARPSADAKGLRILTDAGLTVAQVHGDPVRLQQVTSNLLSNAVKFTPEGGTILVRVRQVDQHVEVVVSDTGQGIAPEFLPHVFEPFRQGDSATTRAHSGLGLGLSIVKSLVEAHDGTIKAFSNGERQGATFVVCLPVASAARRLEVEERGGAGTNASTETVPSLEGISVLVVDDDPDCRDVVAASLRLHDAGVLTAASSAHALTVLKEEHVDVLVADIGMPEEDGYGLIRRVRSSPEPKTASMPAAALTAFARDEDRAQALRAGFQLHVPKPIDERSLVSAVAALARRTGGPAGLIPQVFCGSPLRT